MRRSTGLVLCVALVVVITSTSANEVGLICLIKNNPTFTTEQMLQNAN